MKIEVDTVKGFQDFLPSESLKRASVRKVIEQKYKNYGFLPIETPIIEFEELMKSDSVDEDEAVSDRFRLKDRAGRNLGLRYEFTFQLARIFKQNPNIKLPFRRYQIGEVFRDEPIGKGRFRQFTQCDADIIGDESIQSEAELLTMFTEILKELKIDSKILVNNRKLINAIIESVELSYPQKVMRELDKIEKISIDEIKVSLRKYGDTNQIVTLFKLLEKDLQFFVDNVFEGAKELQELIDLCKEYGIKVAFSPNMIRGLGYYTGNIFEIKGEDDSLGTLAAGGRYDKLVGKFSDKEIPAFGGSFGLERITELASIAPQSVKAILISLDKEKETISLAKKLRKENISCITTFEKAGKALEYANSYEIPFAIFIGQQEVEMKKFKLKNMDSGEEKYLTDKQIIKMLS